MEALEAILTRRSVRDYTTEPVSEEYVERMARAVMAAPSASNQQPWRLVVVRDRSRLEALAAAEHHGAMIAHSSLAFVVCADMRLVRHEDLWIQDCAAATQNLLLAAHALGLGAVWVGTYPNDERMKGVGSVLGLPKHVIPFSVVPVGHPAERPQAVDRFDAKRVNIELYGESA